MSTFNIEELRKETAIAIENKNRQVVIEEDNKSERDELKHVEAHAWAKLQLLSIPTLAKKAAVKGHNRVAVINTKREYTATNKHSNEDFGGWNIKGIGLKYYYLHTFLTSEGFEVDVVYEHDGVGIDAWYTMYIKW